MRPRPSLPSAELRNLPWMACWIGLTRAWFSTLSALTTGLPAASVGGGTVVVEHGPQRVFQALVPEVQRGGDELVDP